MAFTEVRVRTGNPKLRCKECGAPGNHCYDYCPRFNAETNQTAARWDEVDDELLLSPYEKPYRLENWHPEDLIAYVGGGFAKEAYSK